MDMTNTHPHTNVYKTNNFLIKDKNIFRRVGNLRLFDLSELMR